MTRLDASNRAQHQPVSPAPAQPEPASEALVAACAHTAALVLAYDMSATPLTVTFDDPDRQPVTCDEDGTTPRPLQRYDDEPLVWHALECARASHVARICVLVAAGSVRAAVEERVAAWEAADVPHPPVSCELMSVGQYEHARANSCNFELYGLPAAALTVGTNMLADDEELDALLVMSCDQVRITPRHILALHERLASCPGTDVVTSWIQWVRRTPLLLSRSFASGLLDSLLIGPRAGSHSRPLPNIRAEEVVFGEEHIAANATKPAAAERFEAEVTLSARAAVRMAHAIRAASGDDEAPQPANDADALLVNAAMRVLDALDEACAADAELAAGVERADAFGRRTTLDFPLLCDPRHRDDLAYLDSAATCQRLGCALAAQAAFDTGGNANVYRGTYALSMQATAAFNDARAVIERHIGASRRQTVFVENTTAGCNLVAQAWGNLNVHEGDLICVCLAEHHSNLMPWMLLAQRTGAELAYIPLDPDGRIDEREYDRLMQRHPKLVAIAHVGNVLGLRNPVASLAERAHAAGARVMLDAAQSIPHLRVRVDELGADFVAFSGHKLYAPLGTGCLWISDEAFDEMDPQACGGGAISHVGTHSYYLRLGAIQYETGTPAISQAIALAASIRYLDALGPEAIAAHDRALTRYLMCGLDALDAVTVWGDHSAEDGLGGLVSISVANVESAQVGTLLGRLGVAVRSGGHCALPLSAAMGVTGTTRLSLAIHTTREDIEAALAALAACEQLYSARNILAPADDVERHYARIAADVLANAHEGDADASCCCCDEGTATYDPALLDALPAGARAASRGCGDPVARADIAPGERVCDLGSGGGIDALIAARLVGQDGHVYGVDMTEEMVELARRNAAQDGAANVEFLHGRIEDIPLPDACVDVVVSNCVVNLSSDKAAVLAEACRILKPGGRLVVSDIVAFAPVPAAAEQPLRRITGCMRGAIAHDDYLAMLERAGFASGHIEPKTIYTLDVLEGKAFRKGNEQALEELAGIEGVSGAWGSAIVTALKPA